MSTVRTKLGEGGRVIIPTAFRNFLNISQGDDIILRLSDDTIYITTPNQALRKLQAKVKHSINSINQEISHIKDSLDTTDSEVDNE